MEPLRDLAVERGRAGDEEAHPSAEAVADLAEDQPVEERVLQLEVRRDRLALVLELLDLEADREGGVEDLLLEPALLLLHRHDPAVCLLEDARCRAHERRLDDGEVVDDLVRPAVHRGREAAGELGRQQHLAERVRHRQPEVLQVVLGEDALRLDRGALVGPRLVPQPHALGLPGGSRGVDQRGERLTVGAGDPGLDDRGVVRRARSSPSFSRSLRLMIQSSPSRRARRRSRPSRASAARSASPCSFAICPSSSAKTIRHSESARM